MTENPFRVTLTKGPMTCVVEVTGVDAEHARMRALMDADPKTHLAQIVHHRTGGQPWKATKVEAV